MKHFAQFFTVCFLGAVLFLAGSPVFSQTMRVGTNFWDISWGGADPFTDTHKNVTGTNPWRTDFLNEVSVYNGPLRFMDFGKINNAESNHTGEWADRKLKSDPLQKPMAYEWMIDLCNRANKDMWLCVPHNATDSYMQSLATLVKNNLNSDLKCYVEYSNEIWNSQFTQFAWAAERGKALGYATDNYTAVALYNAHIAARTFKIFEDVYGTEKSRLVKVISAQSGSQYYCSKVLEGLGRADVNTAGVQPDQFAVTGYIGGGIDGASATLEADWQAVLTKVVDFHIWLDGQLSGKGFGLIHYEGGHHITTNANAFSSNPKSYGLYTDMLEQLSPYVDLFMHYVHSGSWGTVNAWGAKSAIGQPLADAHKYRALVDFINRDPVAPSAPGSLRSSNVAGTSLTLLWNASTDNIGVTGYNVYRGTTLIGSTTTSTTFQVTGLTAGTSYTFTVKAKDAAGNLSAASNAHTVTTTSGSGSVVYEAENATLSGVAVATNNTGYTGTGFVDFGSTAGQYIQWSVSAATAGTHTFAIRYANGSTADRPLSVSVNGTTLNASMAFPPTGGWSTWSTVSFTANLNAGSNTVRLTLTQSNGPNVDHLKASAATSAAMRIQNGASSTALKEAAASARTLSVHPNPATEYVRVEFSAGKAQVVNYQLSNLMGQPVLSANHYVEAGSNAVSISVSAVNPGVYLLSLKADGSKSVKKVIIRK